LLSLALQHEQPELEQKKSELLKQEETYKVQLAAAERNLLQTLATSKGEIEIETDMITSFCHSIVCLNAAERVCLVDPSPFCA
jgi:hypothetical protein